MAEEEKEIRVVVNFAAAEKPFEENAPRTETVGELKEQVLKAFHLSDGGGASYTLYHEKTPLENLSQTLGQIAGDHHELRLKLVQQITQG